GEGRERKTELRTFEDVDATKVVIRNTKLYVNKEEGFIGTSLKRDEYVGDCSDIDDIIAFTADGKMMVSKVDSKTFVGKGIIHVAVFKKKDKRTIYNLVYKDGSKGPSYIKRFAVTSITRDKEYDLTNGNKNSKALYFSANPNGEAEVITVYLRQVGSVKKLKWDIDFADILIKGRASKGNLVSKHPVKKIELKERGVSTLKPRKIWYDENVQRLNVDERGELVGEFRGEDRILIINQKGVAKTIIPEVTTHFENDMLVMEKWVPKKPISAIYYDGEREMYYVKRFLIENENKEELIISNHPNSFLEMVSTDWKPMAEIEFKKERGKDRKENEPINLEEFISIKGITAQGNQLTKDKVNAIHILESIPYEAPEDIPAENLEVIEEENMSNLKTSSVEGEESAFNEKSESRADKDSGDEDLKLDDNGQPTLF
ncbi:MAG: DNA gyrase/topoisomerase IV subunit A, partial [Bizionia sp.]|nr:DNA gyrase/topoisomerase IV subunit A [Bizionia sp.]